MKTRFCKHFARGFCRYEDTCAYAHGLQELKSRPNLVKTKICINRLAGACSDGSACKYAHDRSEVRSTCSDQTSANGSTTKASSVGASQLTLASSQPSQVSPLTQQLLKSQEAYRRLERLQAWDSPSSSYPQAMQTTLGQSVPPPPMPMQSRSQMQQRLQPSIQEQMLELCRDLGNNPDKAALAASMMELLNLDDEAPAVNLPTKRWGLLANAATRAARKACLTEGSALLAYDRCGNMSFEVGQIVSLLLLRDMGWSAIFPDLSKRCSRQIALRLTSQLSGVMPPQPQPQPQVQTQRAVMRSPPGLGNDQESFSMPASCRPRSIGTDVRIIGA
jgi:hypothetical protein